MRIRTIISTCCVLLAAASVAVTTAAAAPAGVTQAGVTQAGATRAGTASTGSARGAARPSAATALAYRAVCRTAGPRQARCYALWAPQTSVNRAIAAGITGQAATPAGWGAKDIAAAYKLPVARDPHQTVALVDAYHTPGLASYLATYRKQYGLPPCTVASGCFREVNEQGKASPLPISGQGSGWDVETTLDVDMASAACPRCRILVVEASSQSLSDLATAANTAARLGANAISNSYGGREDGYSMTLAGAYNHPGRAIVVASGDSGFTAASFPANLDTVTAVGGTELARAKDKRGWAEQVWNAGGGASSSACSAYAAKPSWQHDPHCPMRTVADVSAVAWNVAIYDAYYGGWGLVAGTSAASPLVAGVYALAGNAAKVKPGDEYSHAGALFNVTTGNNDLTTGTGSQCGYDYLCVAGKGYNAPTGLGTPDGTGAF